MSASETLIPAAEKCSATIPHWIDGKAVAATSGRTGIVTNPATGETIAEVGFASSADVDRAVAAAKRRFSRVAGYAAFAPRRADLQPAQSDCEESPAVCGDHQPGKRQDHGRCAGRSGARPRNVWSSPAAFRNLLKGGYTEQASRGVDVYQIRQPLGVVAGITPFNFPAMVPLWMLSNAIACGNTFILKPSEKVPSAQACLLAELAKRGGRSRRRFEHRVTEIRSPSSGCLSIPTSRRSALSAPRPWRSTSIETATRNGKRVQALGGAKNHMLVLPDADIAMAADAAVSAGVWRGRRALHGHLRCAGSGRCRRSAD